MAAAMLLAGCGESLNKKVPFEEVNIAEVVRDTMLYGFCGEGSAMTRCKSSPTPTTSSP